MDENTRLILAAIENLGKEVKETNARLDRLEGRFEDLESRMNARFEDLESRMNARFEEMESFQETMFAAVQADISSVKADVARVESKIVPPDKAVDQFIDSFNEGKITVQLKKAI